MIVKYPLEKNDFGKSVFELHPAIKCFYNCLLLGFSAYKPNESDILELGETCRIYSNELFKIFSLSTEEQKECFELLQKTYIEARYNKKYKITKDQLLYLIERIELLKEITRKICMEKLQEDV